LYRGFKSRKKYKIYRYVLKRIIAMQKHIRSLITRRKFKKFLYAHKCIVFIQKLYKYRHGQRLDAIVKWQSIYRAHKAHDKMRAKVERKMRRERGEEDEYSSDEESYNLGNISKKKANHKEFETELLNVSMKTNRKQSQMSQKSYALSIDDLENETDKNKIINHLLMDQSLINSKI
jgi:hypothetical protein